MTSKSSPSDYLLDSNILTYLAHTQSAFHETSRLCVEALEAEGRMLAFAPQNAAEFWAVATRRVQERGLGLSVQAANELLGAMEQRFVLLAEPSDLYREWRTVALRHGSTGRHVYDSRLAATMQLHKVSKIITMNVRDFQRFPFIEVFAPEDVLSGRR